MNALLHADLEALVGVLRLDPTLETRFRAFYESLCAADAVPARILDLCRYRIAAIHGLSDVLLGTEQTRSLDPSTLAALRSGNVDTLDEQARIALALAEKIPYGQHDVGDQEVADARLAFGERGAVALLTALAFADVFCRLQIVLQVSSSDAV
jgi:hypothetical protein